jgi:hypothetical protein
MMTRVAFILVGWIPVGKELAPVSGGITKKNLL